MRFELDNPKILNGVTQEELKCVFMFYMEVREDMKVQKETVFKLIWGKCFLHPIIFNLHPTYFLISKNALNYGNKNPELKIIYAGKINLEVVIEFRK